MIWYLPALRKKSGSRNLILIDRFFLEQSVQAHFNRLTLTLGGMVALRLFFYKTKINPPARHNPEQGDFYITNSCILDTRLLLSARHLLFLFHDHLLNHLTADRTSLGRS